MGRRYRGGLVLFLLSVVGVGAYLLATELNAVWFARRPATRIVSSVPSKLDINITGREYRWHIQYPPHSLSPQNHRPIHGQRNVYLPTDAQAKLTLRSDDYLYTFEIPELGVRDIAAPDFEFEVEIETFGAGEYELLGSQMCGYDHPELLGKLVVQNPDDFKKTLASLTK